MRRAAFALVAAAVAAWAWWEWYWNYDPRKPMWPATKEGDITVLAVSGGKLWRQDGTTWTEWHYRPDSVDVLAVDVWNRTYPEVPAEGYTRRTPGAPIEWGGIDRLDEPPGA